MKFMILWSCGVETLVGSGITVLHASARIPRGGRTIPVWAKADAPL